MIMTNDKDGWTENRKRMQSDDNSSHHPKGSGELKKNETVLCYDNMPRNFSRSYK